MQPARPSEMMLIIFHRYNVSKLLQVHFVRALAARLPILQSGVVINMVTPGLCNTEIDRDMSTVSRISVNVLRFLIGRTAEEGSRTLVHAALSGEESHGKYLSDCEIKE
jgi:NAD(P)-dependent dehydrogenase (short-subunit alcohol dehydrogenase family)